MTYPSNHHQSGYANGPHREPATPYPGHHQHAESNTYGGGPTGSFNPPPQNSSASRVILIIALCVAVIFGVGATITAINLFSAEEKPDTDTTATGEPPSSPATVSYTTPDGFTLNSATVLVTPLFDEYTVDIMTMDGVDTYESVFVASYLLPYDTSDYSDDQLVTAIDSLSTVIGKLNSNEPGMTTVAGRDAVQDHIEQEGTSQSTISYDAYFFFDGWYLVQVGCQPNVETGQVEAACQDVMETIAW